MGKVNLQPGHGVQFSSLTSIFIREAMVMVSIKRASMMLIFFVLLWSPGLSLWARTLTVDDDGPAEYSAIKHAIDEATEGDTVWVKAGTYGEWNIVLKEGMVLQGEGADNTFIGGEFEYGRTLILIPGEPEFVYDLPNPPELSDVPVVKHVKIDGFTLSSRSRRGAAGVAIHVGPGAVPSITRNRLVSNVVGIAYQGYDPEIGTGVTNGNMITGNETGILIMAQKVWPIRDLDMRSNWWGTTDEAEIGRGLVHAGSAVPLPVNSVIYRPWMAEPVGDFVEEKGIHYNSIYGNDYDVAVVSPPLSVERMRWGWIKNRMR